MLSLLSDVAGGVGRLVQGELRLARTEATGGLRAARGGLAQLALAAIVGLVGLDMLAGAAVAGLTAAGFGPVRAALIVGLGLCLVALALALAGRAALRIGKLWPARAVPEVRRDSEALAASLAALGDRMRLASLIAEGMAALWARARSILGRPDGLIRAQPRAATKADEGWLTEALTLRQSAVRLLAQIDEAERRGLTSAQQGAEFRDAVLIALTNQLSAVLVVGLAPLPGAARSG